MPMDMKSVRWGPFLAAIAPAVAFLCLGGGQAHIIDESTAIGLTRLPLNCGAGNISAGGDRVAGWIIGAKGNYRAFCRSADEGVVHLGTVSARTSSHAHSISADGSVVVGECTTATRSEAFRN